MRQITCLFMTNRTFNWMSFVLFVAGKQFNIVLKFKIFKLEASSGCVDDYLEIRDGQFGFDPLLFRGCGKNYRQTMFHYLCKVMLL